MNYELPPRSLSFAAPRGGGCRPRPALQSRPAAQARSGAPRIPCFAPRGGPAGGNMNQRALHHDAASGQDVGSTIRLTAAQALVRYLAAQRVAAEDGSARTEPLFGGVFAIFGHGNVAGI